MVAHSAAPRLAPGETAYRQGDADGHRPKSIAESCLFAHAAEAGGERLQPDTAAHDSDPGETSPNERIPLEAYADEPTHGSEPRVVLQLEAGQFHVSAEAAERLIASDVYVRARQLARIGTAPELAAALKSDITRDTEQRVIVPVSAEYLKRRLNSLAEFQKYSKREKQWFPVDCPGDLVANILGYGDWQHFRPLEGIATAPFLRPDLTVCATPGYDAASRVYLAPNAQYPPIPESPNKDDADGAAERLLEPFAEFPFATNEARAAFLSHILTAVARHAIDTRPIYAYTAPIAATGKTLLSGMASRIADGAEPALRPYTDESEEIRKVLLAALLAGDPTLCLDNVPAGAKVRSAILCGFVTAPIYSDRKLGVSESLTLPNRCQVIMTGNNVSPVGDLARRCLVVRLDVNAESARGRRFRIANLKTHVRGKRAQMLVDALTIIRAYAVASDPIALRPLESFERWSKVARDPVAWLGYGDAVETQQLEADDELAPLVAAFEAIAARERFRAGFIASHVAAACQETGADDLKGALEGAGCSDASSAVKVGYWLREHRDRVAGSWKLTRDARSHGVSRFRLRPVR